MTTLKAKITNALIGNEAEREAGATIDAVHAAEKSCTDLDARVTMLASKRLNSEERLENAALHAEETGDHKEYVRLTAELAKVTEELERVRVAQKAAGKRRDEAKLSLHKIGVAGQVKTQKRLTGLVIDNQEEMDQHLEGIARTFKRRFELAERIRLSLPVPVQGGMMLTAQEYMSALGLELWRILPTHPLMKNDTPPLPGAKVPIVRGDPSKVQPLIDAVKEAMTFIVHRVEAGPIKSTEALDPRPAPVATDPTLSADQIMAVMPRVRMG